MGYLTVRWRAVQAVAARQHWVVTHQQLLELGLSAQSIKHRVARGRLHRVHRGVYAVGRPQLTRLGRWMAAVLACGPGAALSHEDAGALHGIRPGAVGDVEVSVPANASPRRRGIRVHRRSNLAAGDVIEVMRIPVTTPVCTLVDLAVRLSPPELERAVNEADRLELVDPETLREEIEPMGARPGARPLRALLDRRTFALTESVLESRLLVLARKAGLGEPRTQAVVNGFKVDFWWPDLGLVVETDGLRYHRTPAQQARDRLRDQAHTAAGLKCLRFTHAQVTFDADYVVRTLGRCAAAPQ